MPIVVDLRPGATPVRNNIQYHGRHAWEFGTTGWMVFTAMLTVRGVLDRAVIIPSRLFDW